MPDDEKELRNLIAQHPDSSLLTENLIQYFRENERYDQAIAETDKAISKDTSNDRWWDIRAILYFENADTLHAIQSYERAIDINPDPQYIMSLGSLYAQTGNPKALYFAEGLMKTPQANAKKEALFIQGLYFAATGEPEKAISSFDNCIALDYNYMFAYREKTKCLYGQGKYIEAVRVMEKAITIQNSFDEGFYWIGKCNEKLGNRAEAIDNYTTALQLDPDYIEAKDALSKLGVK